MKITFFFLLSFIPAAFLYCQNAGNNEQLISSNFNQPYLYHSMQMENHSEFGGRSGLFSPVDSSRIHLTKDDPGFNKRYPLWAPTAGVIGFNATLNLLDTYAFKKYFTRVGFNSWGRNLKTPWPFGNNGWIWSEDKLSMNFIGHPVSGAFYYNAARANGYNYWQSLPFSFIGAYWWKIFGENGPPEREDLINTPVSGAFLGEILYRLSSNILDDRTRGANRVFREIAAGLVNPMREINRLIQGKATRITLTEVYQKEPLNIILSAGVHKINIGDNFGSGHTSEMLDIQVDYGNPFEHRSRRPFDFFRVNMELGNGWGKKYLNILEATGLFIGKNARLGKMEILAGAFQHFDYFDNYTFELSTIGLGGGIVTKLPINSKSNLFTSIYVAGVPFGANSTRFSPDTAIAVGDYNFIGGWQAKVHCALDWGKWIRMEFKGAYYWTHTYVGVPGKNTAGNNYIAMINPRISFRIFKELSIGIEHMAYYSDREPDATLGERQIRTEQKMFLQYYFGNFRHGL